MKITQKNVELVLLLFTIIIATCAYRFGYLQYAEQAKAVEAENAAMETKIDNLKVRIARIEMVENGLNDAEERIAAVLDKYGAGNTPEKTIMLVDEMERSVTKTSKSGKVSSNLTISSISFGTDTLIFESTDLDDSGLPRIRAYNNKLSISYSTTYQGFKDFMDFINSYPERMNVDSFTMAYSSEGDGVSGSMIINLYSIDAEGYEYEAPLIEDVKLGKENIFE